MSIEMENPETTTEKVDAAANLVEQMFIAHKIGDEKTFNEAHDRAAKLLSQAIDELDVS